MFYITTPRYRAPVVGFAFFSSSLGKEKESIPLHSFFRQIKEIINFQFSLIYYPALRAPLLHRRGIITFQLSIFIYQYLGWNRAMVLWM